MYSKYLNATVRYKGGSAVFKIIKIYGIQKINNDSYSDIDLKLISDPNEIYLECGRKVGFVFTRELHQIEQEYDILEMGEEVVNGPHSPIIYKILQLQQQRKEQGYAF